MKKIKKANLFVTVTWGRDMKLTARKNIIQMSTTVSGMLSMVRSEKSNKAKTNMRDTQKMRYYKGDSLRNIKNGLQPLELNGAKNT